jgi:CRISPR-associated endonuclease Cas2
MSKSKHRWYLISYDVCNARRLRKLHYYLTNEMVAVQRSVFLGKFNAEGIDEVIAEVRQRISKKHDDVRVYRLNSLEELWCMGNQQDAVAHLYAASSGLQGKGGDAGFSLSGSVQSLWNKHFRRKIT